MAIPKDKPRAARFEKGSWCIWHKNGNRPSFFHPTREQAEAEAQRLAEQTPGKKFLVLHVVSKFAAEPERECPDCAGLGAFPATGMDCNACLGGGVVVPEQVQA